MYTKGFWEDPERNLRVNFPWEQKVPRISALMVAEPVAAPGSRTKTAGYSVQRVRAPPRRELASRRPGGPSWKPLKRQPHRPDWRGTSSRGLTPELGPAGFGARGPEGRPTKA